MKGKLAKYFRWSRYHAWYEFGALALCILLPMLLPGYILTLDLVFTPHVAFPTDLTNTWLLQVVLWLIYFVLPMDVIEKIILFIILVCSGVGTYRLLLSLQKGDSKLQLGAYFAGLFYMINPFVYSRFMAGQWMVLLGYALLPFCIRSLYLFIKSPSLAKAFRVAMWLFLMLTVSLHMAGIALVAMTVLFIATYPRRFDRRYIKGVLIIGTTPLVLSSFWLVPALLGNGSIGESITNFTKDHFVAFETIGGIGAVLRLQGFWVEARDLYVLPQSLMPLWGVWFIGLWALVFLGAKHLFKMHRAIAITLIVYAVIAIVVSTTPFISWASQIIPQLAGYREPHKFVSLLAFSFALFGGAGVVRTVSYWQERHVESLTNAVKVGLLLLPIIITPTMFWGFSGQLAPRAYPTEWYQANTMLKDQAQKTKTLFLPWHQYANYSFSERIIANPSEKFFETEIVASDQPEFKNLTPTQPNAMKLNISAILGAKRNVSEWLKRNGVGFIVLAKEQDYREYLYLDKDPGLVTVSDNAKLKIYKVK